VTGAGFGLPVMAAGTQFDGIAFKIPILEMQSRFSSYGGVTNSGGLSYRFILELPGDQTATATSMLAGVVGTPEPGTWMLIAGGVATLAAMRQRLRT
jgi:hypothetical protein